MAAVQCSPDAISFCLPEFAFETGKEERRERSGSRTLIPGDEKRLIYVNPPKRRIFIVHSSGDAKALEQTAITEPK